MRLTAFFVSSPFPGAIAPPTARLAVASGLAWGFMGAVPTSLPETLWSAVVFEVLFGLTMGYLLTLIMHAFAYAGEAVSQQMGLRMPGFVNPVAPNLSLLGSAMAMIMVGFFAAGPGPFRLVAFLHRMFELVPVGSGAQFPSSAQVPLVAGAELFAGALEVGAPLIAAVFAAQLVLAILARSVPTLNLFIEGPALTTSAGIIGILASINTYGPMAERMFLRRFEHIAEWFVN
ncbi:MAG: flagellar biosynthetic protein FliR [Myxococcota bacterium]